MSRSAIAVDRPGFADGRRLLIAGLTERYRWEDSSAAIPGQWQRFARYRGRIAGQVGKLAYGISYDTDEPGSIDYLCGVEVSDFCSLPRNFGRLCLSAQRYVVFSHRGHISSIRNTWTAISNEWLPDSGFEIVDAPFFERYAESFNPLTGTGGVEIWIPIAEAADAGTSRIAAQGYLAGQPLGRLRDYRSGT